ncbi:ankyrin repeat [Cedratvirus lausannensis]|uniref:Ankyrin repeat n=1 Tax=Cedratvirus lausannensis TaxID=2023205 RepID=A0A285PY32_9VIRU|nr:ankyrin repeat [Cedratvirus lausannensis]
MDNFMNDNDYTFIYAQTLTDIRAKDSPVSPYQPPEMPWITIKYLYNEGPCEQAAKQGDLQKLQKAREDGHDWNVRVCSNAAKKGHLEVLKWARANGCPWDYRTTTNAAEKGHLDVLKWACENGCPVEEYIETFADLYSQKHIVAWLKQRKQNGRV